MNHSKQFLRKLGVYGFDQIELVIIASLVTEDPLLLIGKSGTGKTYLLNSISEALNLNHRHYNASFISFDDLIGFPYPDSKGVAVTFLKTPATIWDAESVLIDEISRCKPETQNKFFSIIHERKIQGIELANLKYRWAAMNPLMNESTDSNDIYEGSITLDQALADRFAFIIDVPDWNELSTEEQELVIYPAGEGAISRVSKELINLIKDIKLVFNKHIKNPNSETVLYCRIISTLLTDAGYRISPRRARLFARNLTALFLVAKEMGVDITKKEKNNLFKLGLRWSLPHRAWQGVIPDHVIDSVHAECMRMVETINPKDTWLTEFLLIRKVSEKIKMIFNSKGEKETKSLSVMQFLHNDSITRTSIFAFATQPLFEKYNLINEEALNELTNIAVKVMKVDGKLEWREMNNKKEGQHPTLAYCVHYLDSLPTNEKTRIKIAKQFFLYLITNNIPVAEPEVIEKELNNCFKVIQEYFNSKSKLTLGK